MASTRSVQPFVITRELDHQHTRDISSTCLPDPHALCLGRIVQAHPRNTSLDSCVGSVIGRLCQIWPIWVHQMDGCRRRQRRPPIDVSLPLTLAPDNRSIGDEAEDIGRRPSLAGMRRRFSSMNLRRPSSPVVPYAFAGACRVVPC